jgi:hypothetical protein
VAGCKDGADIHGGRGLEEEDEFLPSAGASTVGKRRRVEERVRFLFFLWSQVLWKGPASPWNGFTMIVGPILLFFLKQDLAFIV